MNLERELFEAILENPDDIAPRLIYADWCDEQGDPRGEFIRIQCELAAYEGPPIKVRHLKQREAELWEQNRRAWNGEIHRRLSTTPLCNQVNGRRGLIRKWEYHRGFVEFAVVEARAFLECPEALFQIGPLKRVRILQAAAQIIEIMQSPSLARLSDVELSMPNLRREWAERLIGLHRRPDHSRIDIQPVNCVSESGSIGSYGTFQHRVTRGMLNRPDTPESEREILAFSYFDEPRPIPFPVGLILMCALISMVFLIPLRGCWLD